jgi:hypothetical protein
MTAQRSDAGTGGTAGTVVGFVGLGNMGIPMTRRLVAAGYHMRGFDTSAEALRTIAAIGPGGITVADALGSVGDGATLFRYGGARVLALSNPMQRHLRNSLAARQHVALSEEHYETAGRYLLESAKARRP